MAQTKGKLNEFKQEAEISEYRKKMNFPAEVERTSSINLGSSGSQSTDGENATLNKGNTYNRNSKRGTRLVKGNNNG